MADEAAMQQEVVAEPEVPVQKEVEEPTQEEAVADKAPEPTPAAEPASAGDNGLLDAVEKIASIGDLSKRLEAFQALAAKTDPSTLKTDASYSAYLVLIAGFFGSLCGIVKDKVKFIEKKVEIFLLLAGENNIEWPEEKLNNFKKYYMLLEGFFLDVDINSLLTAGDVPPPPPPPPAPPMGGPMAGGSSAPRRSANPFAGSAGSSSGGGPSLLGQIGAGVALKKTPQNARPRPAAPTNDLMAQIAAGVRLKKAPKPVRPKPGSRPKTYMNPIAAAVAGGARGRLRKSSVSDILTKPWETARNKNVNKGVDWRGYLKQKSGVVMDPKPAKPTGSAEPKLMFQLRKTDKAAPRPASRRVKSYAPGMLQKDMAALQPAIEKAREEDRKREEARKAPEKPVVKNTEPAPTKEPVKSPEPKKAPEPVKEPAKAPEPAKEPVKAPEPVKEPEPVKKIEPVTAPVKAEPQKSEPVNATIPKKVAPAKTATSKLKTGANKRASMRVAKLMSMFE